MKFGNKITEVRKQLGLSQQEVADKLGTHAPVIGRYERNEIKPSIEVAKRLADLYGVSLDYLMSDDDAAQPIKDKQMLERMTEIERLEEKDKEIILHTVDALIREAKTRKAFAT